MQRRRLGSSGFEISRIGLGTWAIGGHMWGGQDDAESIAGDPCVRRSWRQLDRYGAHLRVGAFRGGRRARVEAVAGGPAAHDLHEVRPRHRQRHADAIGDGCARWPPNAMAACGGWALTQIDLYQLHWPAPQPMAETAAACDALLKAGKIRAIGVSNFSVAQLEEWRATGVPLHSDQPPYSILRPAVKHDVLPWCAANGVGVISYSPLFRGMLFGTWTQDKTFPARRRPEHAQGLLRRALSAAPAARWTRSARSRRAAASACRSCASASCSSTPGLTAVIVGARNARQGGLDRQSRREPHVRAGGGGVGDRRQAHQGSRDDRLTHQNRSKNPRSALSTPAVCSGSTSRAHDRPAWVDADRGGLRAEWNVDARVSAFL